MATVTKNFRIKSGLVVEGTTGTINGQNILTETGGNAYILNLVGGATLVKSVAGNLSVDNAGLLTLDEAGLAANLAGTYIYNDGSTLNVDTEGLYNAGFVDTSGSQTLTNKTADNVKLTGTVAFKDGSDNDYLTISRSYTGTARVTANDDLALRATNDVIIYPGNDVNGHTGKAYIHWGDDAANAYPQREIATHGYVDGEISTEVANRNDAIDSAISSEVTNRNSAIDSAISTEVTNRNSAIAIAKGEANTYTDTAVANVVGAAPELLDTLNELAAALQDNPDIISDLQDVAAGKQDTLTAGNGIAIDGTTIGVAFDAGNGLAINGTNLTVDQNVISTKAYAEGVAYDAQTAAETYAAGLISTEVTDRNTAISDAIATEATNRDGAIESAVNNLVDGTTQFTEVSIGWMTDEVAAYVNASTDAQVTAYSWNKYKGASAKFIVRMRNGIHSQVSEILLTRDNSDNIAITEYGIVTTNGILGDITAAVNGSDIELKVTPEHNTGTEIIVSGTLMSYGD